MTRYRSPRLSPPSSLMKGWRRAEWQTLPTLARPLTLAPAPSPSRPPLTLAPAPHPLPVTLTYFPITQAPSSLTHHPHPSPCPCPSHCPSPSRASPPACSDKIRSYTPLGGLAAGLPPGLTPLTCTCVIHMAHIHMAHIHMAPLLYCRISSCAPTLSSCSWSRSRRTAPSAGSPARSSSSRERCYLQSSGPR